MIRLIGSGGWALCLLAAYLFLPSLSNRSKPFKGAGILLICTIALTARLVPDILLANNWNNDLNAYQIVAEKVEAREDIYTASETMNRHPYLPFEMYWMALADGLAKGLGLPYPLVVRLEPILGDTFIAGLIYLILKRISSNSTASLGGLLYALNPIPVLVSAYHGQFDAIPILMVMLSLLAKPLSAGFTGLALGLGVLAKSWPILTFPMVIQKVGGWKDRVIMIGLAGFVPLLGVIGYCLIFHADPFLVIRKAVTYNSGVGNWGYSYVIRAISVTAPPFGTVFQWVIANGRYITLLGLGIAWILWIRKEKPAAGILAIFLVFFSITHAFAIQYLVWVVPFALINNDRKWLKWYTLAAFPHMMVTYLTVIMDSSIHNILPWPQTDYFLILPSTLPIWMVIIVWTIARVQRFRRSHELALMGASIMASMTANQDRTRDLAEEP